MNRTIYNSLLILLLGGLLFAAGYFVAPKKKTPQKRLKQELEVLKKRSDSLQRYIALYRDSMVQSEIRVDSLMQKLSDYDDELYYKQHEIELLQAEFKTLPETTRDSLVLTYIRNNTEPVYTGEQR